jgi:small subunit ribosomal protein S9|tara:strand:- start:100 stop:549 length:450 start_codon:yes stop_codon:yes gene_type:complete
LIPKTEIYFASRKTSNAHVYITKGKGKIRINNVPLEMVNPETAREVMLAPLEIIGDELRDKVDISVRVKGGGFMGQAYSSATAMSRALIGWTKSKKEPKDHPFNKSTRQQLKTKIVEYDKYLISGDARRKEPKKFGGSGARRRKQKSYR